MIIVAIDETDLKKAIELIGNLDPKKALEMYKKDQNLSCIIFAIDAERERISLKLSE